MKKLKVFTWHVHGNYLYYLSQANIDFYIPKQETYEEGYLGKTNNFPWGENVFEIPASKVKENNFDCILFQSEKNYLLDQFKILSSTQRSLPTIYLEHNPPRQNPTDTVHVTQNSSTLLVHVTHFNNLMWDSGTTPTIVIEHGVKFLNQVDYIGDKERGIVVINNLQKRGRRLGFDLFENIRKKIPIDIIGMGSKEIGGLGEIPYSQLPQFLSHYRFFFSPIRYTSLGLSVVEAMMVGLPIIGYATTELPTVITNHVSGFIDTNTIQVVKQMKLLMSHRAVAERMGQQAKEYAQKRFSIERFAREWEKVFQIVTDRKYKEGNGSEFIKGALL